MLVKEVLLLLTDQWADWEAGYAAAEVNSVPAYVVKTIALDKRPTASIGGIRAEIDYTISEYQQFDRLAMLIMPGGFSWAENADPAIDAFVGTVRGRGIPVAAICGATLYLARRGFLDNVRHTGDTFDCFEGLPGYNGKNNYVFAQVVNDNGVITANETAAVAFAREIFLTLQIDAPAEIEEWYDKFQNGMAPR